MSQTVAHLLDEALDAAGIRCVHDVAGDSLNGVTDAPRAPDTLATGG